MKKYYRTTGIILKSVNMLEADRVYTLITPTHGKLKLKAKGIRKISSRRIGIMGMFNKIDFLCLNGKNIDIIAQAQIVNRFPEIESSLLKITVAYHVIELAESLTVEHQENRAVYNILEKALEDISSSPQNITELKQIVLEYQKNLLDVLGFGQPDKYSQSSFVEHIERIIEKPLKSRKLIHRIALEEGRH